MRKMRSCLRSQSSCDVQALGHACSSATDFLLIGDIHGVQLRLRTRGTPGWDWSWLKMETWDFGGVANAQV